MAAHAFRFKARQVSSALIQRFGGIYAHSKLMFTKTGRDIRMRNGVYIGVHANGNRSGSTERIGYLRNGLDLRLRFTVETMNPFLEGKADLRSRLSDARKNNPSRISPGLEHAMEFAAGNYVEARSFLGQEPQ